MDLIAMADPTGVVQPTRLTHKLVVDGRGQAYPVHRIRLDLLRYNRHNGRVSTWVGKYQACQVIC